MKLTDFLNDYFAQANNYSELEELCVNLERATDRIFDKYDAKFCENTGENRVFCECLDCEQDRKEAHDEFLYEQQF